MRTFALLSGETHGIACFARENLIEAEGDKKNAEVKSLLILLKLLTVLVISIFGAEYFSAIKATSR